MKGSILLLAFTSFSFTLGAFTCSKSSDNPNRSIPNDSTSTIDSVIDSSITNVPVTFIFQADSTDIDDVHLDYYINNDGNNNANGGSLNELPIYTWTVNGNLVMGRALLRFNLDKIPDSVEITSAKLSLYGMPANFPSISIPQGNYGDNAVLLQRVTSPWNEYTATWNNQPTTTTVGQLTLAGTSNTWGYDINGVDVTSLIQDMKEGDNYGFCIKLETEKAYRSIGFLSSEYADSTKRPKLELTYKRK
ncbi:hypothetical protein SAMN05421788_11098 [Filimonas lacunae]|uniref:Carbohydrate-binding module family 96 domain-containing protein n=1 Tax=Filimonas lacunae TaxID=477680 RepID=A0A173MA33_9BACT|nr:DNRLRE domain-containing protein [Filimonas lacunae]BAV04371.1 NHL repeat protein [Filimonas lacunae]SIT31180.1 hypothetical protein SAMN05421788_11098 [Filimonas lacunae]